MADVTKLNIGGTDYNIVDASVPSWAKQNTKPSYAANEISGLATVATSGSYNDLSNKPTIPTIGTLNTNNSTAQAASSSESFSGNINHYTCFIKDTEISLASGDVKKIQDVTYDDELLVWNFDEGKYDNAKPLWIKKVQTTNWYYKLTFSDGTILKVTGVYPEAHSLYSVEDGKFVHANNLVGKKVYTLNGVQTLDSCEEIHEDVEFYNIITYYHMNLFANNVLTSTSLNNLYPIRDMMFIKDNRKPAFDVSRFDSKWINGLRLDEQQENVIDYVNNLIRLQQ